MKLIAFTGYAGVGKDSAAKALIADGWVRVSFADPIREFLLLQNPIIGRDGGTPVRLRQLVEDRGGTAAKQSPEVRRLLQATGDEAAKSIFGESCWIAIANRKVDEAFAAGKNVVITDLRFKSEEGFVRGYGGKIIRLTRYGVGPLNAHRSEAEIETIMYDAWIANDVGLAELHALVRTTAARI